MSTTPQRKPPAYRTHDGRAVLRCSECGAHVESNDKQLHTKWHKSLWKLMDDVHLELHQAPLFDEESNPNEQPPPF